MYLKDNFKDSDGNLVFGKVIKMKDLIKILEMLPEDVLLNCNGMTDNINVFDKGLIQLGYIDIGEDSYEKF